MKAGLAQLPLLLSTPAFAAVKLEKQKVCVGGGCGAGNCEDGHAASQRGPPVCAELTWPGGGSQAPGCSVGKSTALSQVVTTWETANLSHSAPEKGPRSEAQVVSLASFGTRPSRDDQREVTLPRLSLRPPQSRNRDQVIRSLLLNFQDSFLPPLTTSFFNGKFQLCAMKEYCIEVPCAHHPDLSVISIQPFFYLSPQLLFFLGCFKTNSRHHIISPTHNSVHISN